MGTTEESQDKKIVLMEINFAVRQRIKTKPSYFLFLLWLVMCLSGIVFIEPAPVDFGVVVLTVSGLMMSRYTFFTDVKLPAIFLFSFLAGNLTSILLAEDISRAISYFLITLYMVVSWVFFLGVSNRYGERVLRLIFSGYTVAAVTSAFTTVLAYFNVVPFFYSQALKFGRGAGFFKDPNVFGPFLIPVCLYALSRFEDTRNIKRFLWIGIYMLLTLGVFISFSRAGWGNFVIAHIAYFAIKFRNPSFKKIGFHLFFSCITTLSILFWIWTLFPEFQETFMIRFGVQNYDSQRFSNQYFALTLALENPFGIGPGQFENWYATHNVYLRVLAENGLLAFCGFISFVLISLFRSLRMAIRNINPVFSIVSASILGILLNSFVIDSLHWRHFWLLLALSWVTLETSSHGEAGRRTAEHLTARTACRSLYLISIYQPGCSVRNAGRTPGPASPPASPATSGPWGRNPYAAGGSTAGAGASLTISRKMSGRL